MSDFPNTKVQTKAFDWTFVIVKLDIMLVIYHQKFHTSYSLERVSLAGLLDSLQNLFVNAEADSDSESGQREVGEDAEHREESKRQEEDKHATKHYACLLGVPPVHQVNHCNHKRIAISES